MDLDESIALVIQVPQGVANLHHVRLVDLIPRTFGLVLAQAPPPVDVAREAKEG